MMRLLVLLAACAVALPAMAAPDCSCEHYDVLQQELENAVKLRDAHRAKADEMERRQQAGESPGTLKREYSGWESDASKGAGAGVVATTGSKQEAIGYVPRGAAVIDQISGWTSPTTRNGYTTDEYDAAKAHAIEDTYKKDGKDLCDFADEAAVRKSAEATSVCSGISKVLVDHEESHRATCRRMGYIAFFMRSAAELARDEVKAYDQQIVALEQAIAKSLKGAELQFEDETKSTWSAQMMNFRYAFATAPMRGAIPENDGKSWKVGLKGVHRMTPESIVIMGKSCSMTSFSRDVEVSVNASGKQASVAFTTFGKTPPSRISCPGGLRGGSPGVGAESGQEGYSMPLKLASDYAEDLSKSKMAAAARGVAKVSGTYRAKLSIICPPAPK